MARNANLQSASPIEIISHIKLEKIGAANMELFYENHRPLLILGKLFFFKDNFQDVNLLIS